MIHGAIAAGHPETAEAGAEVLRAGGNAVDAAVAAACASFAAEPTLTSLAGGGYLTVAMDGRAEVLDFFTRTPGLGGEPIDPSDLDFFPVEVDFGDSTQVFHIGAGSMAVPGTAAGLVEAHARYGSMPLADLVAPAQRLARDGVVLNDLQAYFIRLLSPIITNRAEVRAIYSPDGPLLEEGYTIRNPGLADAFELLVREGAEGLRTGTMAQAMLAASEALGGLLTAEDLARYEVSARPPLRFPYRGGEILTNPPPSAGGTLIAYMLRLLEPVGLRACETQSAEALHTLARAMERTNELRTDAFAASVRDATIAQPECDPALVEELRKLAGTSSRMGSTTHVSVMDTRGGAASLTSSNGEGSGVLIPSLGLHMNNMLGEEDLHPDGFHTRPAGEAMSSMMAPTLVVRDGRPTVALGSGGSNRLRTAIVQVLLQIVECGRSPYDAVHAPRIHFEGGELHVEPGMPHPVMDELEQRGHYLVRWESRSMYFGGVHTVQAEPAAEAPRFHGAGDPRRGGVFVVVED